MAVEVEFRDGVQAVADHVAALLRGIDTTSMTKAEAIKASESQMLKDHLNRAQKKLVSAHFREFNR
jgi:ElaB/YqjD/DUF883 family membrane-anchored ribosome-binding protein